MSWGGYFSDAWSSATDAVKGAVGKVATGLNDAGKWVSKKTEEAADWVVKKAKAAGSAIKSGAMYVAEKVVDLAESAWNGLKDLYRDFRRGLKFVSALVSCVFGDCWNKAAKKTPDVGSDFENIQDLLNGESELTPYKIAEFAEEGIIPEAMELDDYAEKLTGKSFSDATKATRIVKKISGVPAVDFNLRDGRVSLSKKKAIEDGIDALKSKLVMMSVAGGPLAFIGAYALSKAFDYFLKDSSVEFLDCITGGNMEMAIDFDIEESGFSARVERRVDAIDLQESSGVRMKLESF